MIKKYFTILITLLLISALFIPGVMAQENEQRFLNETLMPIVDIPSMSALNDTEILEIADFITAMLELDGLKVENLDLSNLKYIETESGIITAGKISFEFQNTDSKSFRNSNTFKEFEFYSNFDYIEKSNLMVSKSKTDDEFYKINRYLDSEDENTVTYLTETTVIKDGILQKNIESSSADKEINSVEQEISSLIPTRAVVNKPSNPPSGSTLVYSDLKLQTVIIGGSALTLIAGIILGTITGGVAIPIIVGALTLAADVLLDNYLYKYNLSPQDTYMDVYQVNRLLYTYNAAPAWGDTVVVPPLCLYLEITRYGR
ncbi:hypothetical protein MmiHf6_08060 [Methanimicrococcus hongohii]|uniref:Uncharacterized protein n=1 Tax=Methanimicrococcus hongohii TaxID=3028295 RepID=A0AA96UZE3_9EURY|nr:hypothetical protein [Methanimicrococcus sp. Hf6]WNY23499.1 hypothetical protein MmiHf6_08060 [Methanimicrococcus sp. Hf6]